MLRFLNNMFPRMDERDQFTELCGRFESKSVEGVVVTLKEATFMKLFCDAYFMRQLKHRNAQLRHLQEELPAESSLGDPTAPHASSG